MPRLMRRGWRAFCLLFFLTACTDRYTGRWQDRVEEFRLKNGMTFLLVPHGETPIFTATIRFRAGGIDEEPGKTGLAHFLEHMAFKGTQKIGTTNYEEEKKILERIDKIGEQLSQEYSKGARPNTTMIKELRERLRQLHEEETKYLVREEVHKRMIEAGGEDYNATTSKDMTSYFVSLPTDQLSFWAEWESERIFRPIFREFYEEKDVVLEERRSRVDDDPDGQLYEKLLETAFQKSPYRWPTIGSSSDLLRLTSSDLRAFWQKHYQPANAVGALVGRFDLEEAKRLLERTFGKIPPGPPLTESVPPAEPLQRVERRVVLKESARPRLKVAYHKPTLPDWDDYLFDLLDQVMASGRSSRLYEALILKEKVASQVEIDTAVPGSRLPNLFVIEVAPLGNHTTRECLRVIDDEIRKIQTEGITDQELQRAKNRLTADLVWRLQTNEGLSSELSYFQVVGGSWKYLTDYAEKISRATPAEIARIAQTYLLPERRTIAVLEP